MRPWAGTQERTRTGNDRHEMDVTHVRSIFSCRSLSCRGSWLLKFYTSAILWNMAKLKKPSRTSSNGRQKSAAAGHPSPAAHVRRQERTIHFLTQDELRRLFKVIHSKRDKAIFLLAYRRGLRASEIGLLKRADVDVKQGRISIHRLKGSISGIYPMQPDVLKTIRSYLRTRADESPYLFLSNRRVPISRYMLHHLMQTYGEQAGLPVEKRKFHASHRVV